MHKRLHYPQPTLKLYISPQIPLTTTIQASCSNVIAKNYRLPTLLALSENSSEVLAFCVEHLPLSVQLCRTLCQLLPGFLHLHKNHTPSASVHQFEHPQRLLLGFIAQYFVGFWVKNGCVSKFSIIMIICQNDFRGPSYPSQGVGYSRHRTSSMRLSRSSRCTDS